jgi:hypothetical protein
MMNNRSCEPAERLEDAAGDADAVNRVELLLATIEVGANGRFADSQQSGDFLVLLTLQDASGYLRLPWRQRQVLDNASPLLRRE